MEYLNTKNLNRLILNYRDKTKDKTTFVNFPFEFQRELIKLRDNCNSWATFYLEKARELKNVMELQKEKSNLVEVVTETKIQSFYFQYKEMKDKIKLINAYSKNL